MLPSADVPILRAVDVVKRFGSTEVLRGMSLTVRQGEIVALIGPSGCGKSTFLRCVNHLETIDGGLLQVEGEYVGYRLHGDRLYELRDKEVSACRARVGMVFQRFNLFAHMTALQNVAEGPVTVKRERRRDAEAHAMSLLEQVDLAGKAHFYPSSLSGGQQQRVAIARALAMRPSLLLLDEPTSALDPDRVAEVSQAIKDLAARGTTMLLVTHEMGLVHDVSTRVAVVESGRIVDEGAPEMIAGRSARGLAVRAAVS